MNDDLERSLDWFQSAGVNVWNFCVLTNRGMLGHERARDRSEVLRSSGWAWVKNQSGCNIYMRPARSPDPIPAVFLDDLPPDKARGIAHKYRSLVLETSRDNCQVWISTSRALTESERLTVQRALCLLIGGDYRSISGEHFGRAPGFINQKPGRNGWKVRVLTASSAALFDPTSYLSEPRVESRPPAGGGGSAFTSVGGSVGGDTSESAREFGYCLSRLAWAARTGRDPQGEFSYLVANLADRARSRGKRKTRDDALQYAELTVTRAARRLGFL